MTFKRSATPCLTSLSSSGFPVKYCSCQHEKGTEALCTTVLYVRNFDFKSFLIKLIMRRVAVDLNIAKNKKIPEIYQPCKFSCSSILWCVNGNVLKYYCIVIFENII